MPTHQITPHSYVAVQNTDKSPTTTKATPADWEAIRLHEYRLNAFTHFKTDNS